MQKPVKFTVGGKVRWSHTQPQLIEYIFWERGGPVASADVTEALFSEYGQKVVSTNVHGYITALINSGRVFKITRGVYIHADHAAIFD